MEVVINMSGENIGCTITVFDANGEKRIYKIPEKESHGHGSADEKFRDAMFKGLTEDPLGQTADSRSGAMSIGIGIAATTSMREDRAVTIKELFDYL